MAGCIYRIFLMLQFITTAILKPLVGLRFGWPRKVVLFLVLFLGLGAPVLAGQGKLALVVGNQAYQNLPRLANPGNDARGMADALRRLGFEVTLLTDVNTEVFNVVVKAFGFQAKSAETVVFYYSGHAFQLDGQNHLLPVAVKPDANGAVDGQTWKLDDVISELQAPDAQTLVFLDACRNSPIEGRAGMRDGLAQMQTNAGTFISFATRPGAVSFDRDGALGNSPYTSALLNHMEKPGLSISDLMIRVRNDVETATSGQQTPWDQSSLRSQFYFNPAKSSPELPVFEIVSSDTIISPPAPEEPAEQVAALEPPKPGPVIQRIEAQDQTTNGGEATTRAAPPVLAAAAPSATPEPSAPAIAASVAPAVPTPTAPAALVPPVVQPEIPEDIASAVQTELKRVGCYNMRVDGDWGNGSRRALSAYLDKTDTKTDDGLEPSAELYLTLLKEPEGICPPVVVRSAPKTVRKKVVKRSTKAAPKRAAAAPAKKAPAPAPVKKKTKCTFMVIAIVCK
jgi:hypothetical protein